MSIFDGVIIKSILHSMPVGILVIDKTGNISITNRAACTLLGYSHDQLMGKGWGEIFFEEDQNYEFNQVLLDVISNERVGLQREVSYIDPTGKKYFFSVTSSFHSQDATILGIIFLIHDVTELNRIKEKETQILREKGRLQEHKIQSLNNLASSVAHQIRNPVFTIAGFANRLDKQLKERHLESAYPGIIVEETKRLERIVQGVARFASLAPKSLQRTRLSELVDRAFEVVRGRAIEQGRTVTLQAHLEDVWVCVDVALFPTVFEEIFFNSLDFSSQNSVVLDVAVVHKNEHIAVTIRDNGPGIDLTCRDYVFDPFFTTKSDGVGMGLTVAREIVLEHKGDITMLNADTGGALLVLNLVKDLELPTIP